MLMPRFMAGGLGVFSVTLCGEHYVRKQNGAPLWCGCVVCALSWCVCFWVKWLLCLRMLRGIGVWLHPR